MLEGGIAQQVNTQANTKRNRFLTVTFIAVIDLEFQTVAPIPLIGKCKAVKVPSLECYFYWQVMVVHITHTTHIILQCNYCLIGSSMTCKPWLPFSGNHRKRQASLDQR